MSIDYLTRAIVREPTYLDCKFLNDTAHDWRVRTCALAAECRALRRVAAQTNNALRAYHALAELEAKRAQTGQAFLMFRKVHRDALAHNRAYFSAIQKKRLWCAA